MRHDYSTARLMLRALIRTAKQLRDQPSAAAIRASVERGDPFTHLDDNAA